MARNEPQVNLRMPAPLKDALDKCASENKRSLTAEIIARLESTFALELADAGVREIERTARDELIELRERIARMELLIEKSINSERSQEKK